MKKKSESDQSAKRVNQVIADKKTSFVEEQIAPPKKSHEYELEKPPPLVRGMSNISSKAKQPEGAQRRMGKAQIIPQKVPQSALEQMHCTANQNYPLFFLEKSDAFNQKKIKNFKTKERLIATCKIKQLSLEMQQWIYSQVSQDVKIIKSDPIEFYDLIEQREERHFRIDRIIQYLSDI